jgi:hypothetical protein
VCSVVDPDESAINFGPLDPDPHWERRPESGIQEDKKGPTKKKKKIQRNFMWCIAGK